MKYFAHFFIGKEFAETVSNIGKQILKYSGNEKASAVNLFLIDDAKVSRLQCSSTAADELLTGFDQNIEIAWNETGSLETTNLKVVSEFYAENIFDQILTINNRGNNSVLHVILHFPLYKPEALETAKLLYNAIENAGRPTDADFMGYCDDIAKIIEPDFKIKSPSNKQIAAFAKFKEEKGALKSHFIAVQNTSQNGISLGLNNESLGDVIGRFAMLCVDNYGEIFHPTIEYKDVVSFGLSTLYLDKYLFVEYLLGKTILHSMDNAEVNNNVVDVNFACDTANLLLKDKTTLLSELFKQTDFAGKDDKEEFPKIQQQFEDEIIQIIQKCKEIFQANKSITARTAILASLLAKTECELFSNTIFNHDAVSIDNLFGEPIDYFIDNDKTEFYKIDDEPVVNPIRELKEINNKLINSETEIRYLQEKLTSLEKQISDAQKVEDCYMEDGFFHCNNQKFRLLPALEQEPLAETYEARETTVSSIDLRQNFNSVKNQGAQGSCLAHAIVSIFEYAMKLNQQREFDLSEAFLYYNARHLDDEGDVSVYTDTGSRFKPAMDSLQKFGIALEKYCPYNEETYDKKPNEEAYQDALNRRLIAAKNVNRTVFDIKSALTDGYPVAISLNLYPSFNAVNGFIPMPSQQEIDAQKSDEAKETKHSRHAMVITGFCDKLQMFVVRNSWGENWGENGYCYIPYSYIGNEELCNFSCIITEIEHLEISKMERVPALKIDDTALNIKYIIAKNALEKEMQEADENRRQSGLLRVYFERIKKLFSAPNQRDEFIEKAKEHLKGEQEEIRETIKTKEKEKDKELEEYDDYKKRTVIQIASFLFGTVFFVALYNRLVGFVSFDWWCWFWQEGCVIKPNWFWIIACALTAAGFIFFRKPFIKHFGLSAAVVLGLISINFILTTVLTNFNYTLNWWWLIPAFAAYGGFVFYKANKRWKEWRDKRDHIDEEIRRLKKEIANKEKEINNFKIKTFSAWTLLKSLEKSQAHFQLLYGNMTSLINNLRTWYKEVSETRENSKLETATPNTSLLSAEVLDAFFDTRLIKDAVFEIDLCEGVENHKIEEGYLKGYKDALFEKIAKNLLEVKELQEFDISAHAVDNRFSEIAVPITRDLANDVDNKSGLFLNISSNERGIIVPSTGIYAPSLNLYKDSLRKKLGKHSDPYFEASDKYRLVFLKTAALWFRECVNLKPE